ncbi:phosphatase PAP2 family protein [Komagataeibacter nataicola]|uniref:Acid phosphatase n=1 Tax=Komagataeibacter nataicola TaxID=265960 RepID=A0ABX5P795_9PROT|nr:phosphatase PAP2 family protein [Komagataeibacter nataicola]PYD65124.1 acid phosphatase [Komagataeibacter nataicola]WEQ56857.1 phosphatase PAP2 family protein [Komagataeibacter nataicola]GBR25434.1 acid phosphatase precursor [Komagataeibacter nataicola NRIC 0616]
MTRSRLTAPFLRPASRLGLPLAAALLAAPWLASAPCLAADPLETTTPEQGYFTPATQPDATAYLPPPPQPGTVRQANDDQAFTATRALRDTPRWALAKADADLHANALLHSFSCAAGLPLSTTDAPKLSALIHKMDESEIPDMRKSKAYWHRPRPFVGNSQPICTEKDRAHLATSGAYPSGHTMLGWSTALVLAELLPERATQILQRGRVFGESRIVCGVHWESDVQAGYMLGSAEIAAMHASPAFRTDMDAARTELAALRSKAPATATPASCALEQEAASHSPL